MCYMLYYTKYRYKPQFFLWCYHNIFYMQVDHPTFEHWCKCSECTWNGSVFLPLLLHVIAPLLRSVLQCESVWGEAALCCIQLCGHWHRYEPLGRVISLQLHWTNFTNLAKFIIAKYHNCQWIAAVYNKELYENIKMTGICIKPLWFFFLLFF